MNLKDKTIKVLVDKILKRFASNGIKINDYWDADLCAIGFADKNDNYLVYVSTYRQNENEYFVSLEETILNKNLPYEPTGDFTQIKYNELESIIKKHLIDRV